MAKKKVFVVNYDDTYPRQEANVVNTDFFSGHNGFDAKDAGRVRRAKVAKRIHIKSGHVSVLRVL